MNLFCLFFIFLLLLPVQAQEGESQVTRPEDLPNRVQVMQEPTPSQVEEAPQAPVSEEDAELAKLEEERAQQTATAVALDQSTSAVTEKVFNAPEELKKIGYETIDAAAMLDPRVLEIVRKTFIESPLRKMPDDEVRKLILEKAGNSPIGNYLHDHPKVVAMFVEILKDEKALPNAVGLFAKRDDLRTYFFIWLGVMIAAWVIKKFWVKKQKKWSGSKIFLVSMGISLGATAITLTTFYNMFEEEISPTAKIMLKHWRKRNLKT